jgi:hypothetical protein
MLRAGTRERSFTYKLPCGEESECRFLAPLKDDGCSCLIGLYAKRVFRRFGLAKKCFPRLQFDNRSARPGICQKYCGIESRTAIAGQNATSLQAVCFSGLFVPRRQ